MCAHWAINYDRLIFMIQLPLFNSTHDIFLWECLSFKVIFPRYENVALFSIFSFELVKELGNRQILKTSLESGKTLISKDVHFSFAMFPCHVTFSYVMFELLYRCIDDVQSVATGQLCKASVFSIYKKLVSASANVIVIVNVQHKAGMPTTIVLHNSDNAEVD